MTDWNKVKARFKKLKTVEKYRKRIGDKHADLWTPQALPLDEATYLFLLSDRSRGKTTQVLLLLMLAAWDNDKRIEYVRTTEEEAAPKNTAGMFDVILDYDYIDIITGGKYNGVKYQSRYWYYTKTDKDGKITDISEKPFMHLSCVRKYMDLKSGYNSPASDYIIYDEMIGKEEAEDFERYMQLQSTFFRMRKDCKSFFLSNTIKKDANIFYEFTIAKPIEKMQQGDSKIIKNPLGTVFYIELLFSDKSQTKRDVNREYYGFTNPKLASITGAETWAFKQYQHIKRGDHEILSRNIYIYYHAKYYRCDIVNNDIGLCIYCHRATRIYDDSQIFTLEEITDPRYIFGLGYRKKHLAIWKLLKNNRWYFDTNETGDAIERYYMSARKIV